MANKILCCVTTLAQMLTDRGLDPGELASTDLKRASEMLDQTVARFDLPDRRVVMFFMRKLKNQDIVKAAEGMDEEQCEKAIVVCSHKITTGHAKYLLNGISTSIEVFEQDKLVVNVSRHCLVPKHELVPRDSVANTLASLGVRDAHKLPGLLTIDPMSMYIGAKEGDVVKVTRKSPSVGTVVVYRHVRRPR